MAILIEGGWQDKDISGTRQKEDFRKIEYGRESVQRMAMEKLIQKINKICVLLTTYVESSDKYPRKKLSTPTSHF